MKSSVEIPHSFFVFFAIAAGDDRNKRPQRDSVKDLINQHGQCMATGRAVERFESHYPSIEKMPVKIGA
ncbi:MAG TPA: hypothetical protein PLG61_00465 [Methanoregulaceae archaeon]|jgi:hypothetical protein|nr:hypothetical protein [Methanoregulaceae archaeon]MDD5049156.1 hypothetical protein [Methanoregulaceae archaeon]MDD5684307.1 hypothetical protein [Methanoregulaceae archaeon]HOP66173.1 hypothetical protein [Methanoregulaceae archaeon]HQA79723.1 hypothetical protein [Methanoregulaceae archaeon]